MKVDATILLIQEYSTIHVEVDKDVDLKDLMELAGIQGRVLFAPSFFVFKEEKPLEVSGDGFFCDRASEEKGCLRARAVNGRYPKIV